MKKALRILFPTIAIMAFSACHSSKPEASGSISGLPRAVPTPGASGAPLLTVDVLLPEPLPDTQVAELVEMSGPVTLRRKSELLWKDAEPKARLFAFDALQVGEKGSALVLLTSGASLRLGERSLIIFNPATLKTLEPSPQATVRKGSLAGETDGNLWLLTSAALFQLSASGSGERARATLAIEEGKKLRIEVKGGVASLLRDARSVRVAPGTPVVLDAPVAPRYFGWLDETIDWPGEKKPAAIPSPKLVKKADESSLVVLSPKSYSEVHASSISVNGKASAGKSVQINGRSVSIGSQGEFHEIVPLRRGANNIVIQASGDGPPVFRELVVIRRDR